jgi:uncharacterized membrane protein
MAGRAPTRSFAAMTAYAIEPRRSPFTLAAQVLLALLGALSLFGSVFFTVTDADGAAEWSIGALALAIAIGLLAAARDPRIATTVVAAHIAFGVLKVVAYGESAAFVFIAADLVVLGLLAAGRPRR